jgi:hypothetical protein
MALRKQAGSDLGIFSFKQENFFHPSPDAYMITDPMVMVAGNN